MPDDETLTKALNIRMSEADMELLETLQKAMQERVIRGMKVTQRMVILAALEALEKVEKERSRKR